MSAPTLDPVFEALANPARREIVTTLSRGPSPTPDLAEAFDISKQALSKHLQLLESAGLIARRRRGRTDEIELVVEPFEHLTTWATTITDVWNHNLDRLATVLDEHQSPS